MVLCCRKKLALTPGAGTRGLPAPTPAEGATRSPPAHKGTGKGWGQGRDGDREGTGRLSQHGEHPQGREEAGGPHHLRGHPTPEPPTWHPHSSQQTLPAGASQPRAQRSPHQDDFGLVQLRLHSGHRVGIAGVLGEKQHSVGTTAAGTPAPPGPWPHSTGVPAGTGASPTLPALGLGAVGSVSRPPRSPHGGSRGAVPGIY